MSEARAGIVFADLSCCFVLFSLPPPSMLLKRPYCFMSPHCQITERFEGNVIRVCFFPSFKNGGKRFQYCRPFSVAPKLSTGIWDGYLQLPILLCGLGFELSSDNVN